MKNRQKFTVNESATKMHPRDKANFLVRLFFCWQIPLLRQEAKSKISDEDFVVAVKDQESKMLGEKLELVWNKETKNPSLIKILVKLFGPRYFFFALLYFLIDTVLTLLQPLCFKKLLDYFAFDQKSMTKQEAYISASILISCSVFKAVGDLLFFLESHTTGAKIRTGLYCLVFKKILTLPKVVIDKVTIGRILNLFSSDVEKFDRTFSFMHYLWIGPLKVIIVAYFLHFLFGYEGLAGIIVAMVYLLTQFYFFKTLAAKKMKISLINDQRIRLMHDILAGIRTVKLYTWEKPFTLLIKEARRSELGEIKRANLVQNTNNNFSWYLNKMSVFVSVLVIVLLGTPLTSQIIFTTMFIHDSLKQTLFFAITGTSLTSEVQTSLKRIQEFLDLSGKPTKTETRSSLGIIAKKLRVGWDLSSPVLKRVDFELSAEELAVVVGAAGSGKSTLLQAFLQELDFSGDLNVGGSVSYAPQPPWIFPGSVKDNILFGRKYDEAKYLQVMRVCCLEHDISSFPFGDKTLVGERGILLSGGQKARISLARAVYTDADIYLFDDPLSAVDNSVAHHIFTECFSKFLKEKSVVLVTHRLHLIRNVKKIYIVENGEIRRGKYEELDEKLLVKHNPEAGVETQFLKKGDGEIESKDDSRCSGVNFYKRYLSSAGHWTLSLLQLVLLAVAQFFLCLPDVFLAFWTYPDNSRFLTNYHCLFILISILLVTIFFHHLHSWVFVNFCKKASKSLHDRLLTRTIKGTMQFFDSHPSGRMLNRFSRELTHVDEGIPRSLILAARQVIAVVATCIILVVINYWILIPSIILFLLFYLYWTWYQPAINHFRKLAATRKNSIFTHVSATVEGLATIRALKAQDQSLSRLYCDENSYNSVEYLQKATHISLSFWTNLTSVLYTAVTIFCFLIFETNVISVGLAMTQCYQMIISAQSGMKMFGDLNAEMISVERIADYADFIPTEVEDGVVPAETWPSRGSIRFQSVALRYSLEKTVLKNISFEIKSGEKIGIVGRTGSGKTSLTSVLFRLYDFQGNVFIDGVDTKSVPLNILRSNLAVIPQDPVLFIGSVRKNLDPFDEFSDSQLWSALEDVKLKTVVASLPSGLESIANFSVGQKQMLCLVRAVLKNAKIVVLDEATASIDMDTDELIQTTIRRRFAKSTVLTIAHRLETVMDSDRILVMDDGRVVEFGPREELLRDENGYFKKYVNHWCQ